MAKFIEMKDLSEDAHGILAKAAVLQGKGDLKDEKYLDLYQEFQKATNFRYLNQEKAGDSFESFRCAVLNYKRKRKPLFFKTELGEVMTR